MATLSGNKIKNTYQSLVKFSDNGNITTSAKQLTDGFGNNSPMFVSTTQVGIGVTPESGLNLHVFGDAKIGSNLTVIGNLVVEGSTTTVGTDTLTVKDPLIVLANNNTSTDAVDIGFYGKYTPSGTTLYSGLFREALTGKYRLFKGLEVEPTTTVNTSGTGYAQATLIASLEGNVTGNLTGNVTGGTISGTTGTFSGNVDIDGTLDVDDVISVEGSAFGRIEIGGASGGYIDLKAPNSDDYDFRIITSSGGNELTTASGDLIFNTAETLALTLDTSQNATFAGDINLPLNKKIQLGNNQELEIYRDANDSRIVDEDSIIIKSQHIAFQAGTSTETIAHFYGDSSVELYYDGVKKFSTTSAGIDVTGTGSFSGQVTIPETPVADTDAASKGYVDTALEGQDTLAEVLAIGNTSSGTSMIISNGDDLTVNTSTLKVDSTNSKVGINNSNPNGFTSSASDLIIGDGSSNQGMTIYSSNQAYGQIYFQDAESTGSSNGGFIAYSHVSDFFEIGLAGNGLGAGSLSISETSVYTKENFIVDASFTNTYNTLTVDASSGKVGIRNNAPTYPLDVNGGARITGLTYLSSDLTVGTDSLFVDVSTDSVGIGLTNPSAYSADTLVINTPDEKGITLVSSSTEKAYLAFQDGTGALENFMSFDHAVNKMNFNVFDTGGDINFSIGEGVTKFNIDNTNVRIYDDLTVDGNSTFAGNVGIGVTGTPEQKLHVEGASITVNRGNDDSSIAFQNSTSGATWRIGRDYSNSEALTFAYSATDYPSLTGNGLISIDTSGNVGIGITEPLSKLHISGQSGTTGLPSLLLYGESPANGQRYGFNVSANQLDISALGPNAGIGFYTGGSASSITQRMRIDSSGITTLTAEGYQLAIVDTSSSNKSEILTSNNAMGFFADRANAIANSSMIFSIDNSTKMTIDSSGNSTFAGTINSGAITTTSITAPNGFLGGSNGGIRIHSSGTKFFNITAANAARDNIMDIGAFDARFANLYLGSEIISGGGATFAGNVTISQPTNGAEAKLILTSKSAAGNSRTGIVEYDADTEKIFFINESTTVAAMTSGGNVGIGTDSPFSSAKLQVRTNTDRNVAIQTGTTHTTGIKINAFNDAANTNIPLELNGSLLSLKTGETERMRITSGGTILFGRTSADISIEDGIRFDPNGEAYASIVSVGANAWHVYDMTNDAYRFYVTAAGQIHATSTSITAISDVTLKENIKPLETGLDEVMKLQPRRFDWKNGDGKNIAGFVAQEVEEVLPDLVSDYKYNDEETKKSLKMGDMIPTLVKAIQELKAEVDKLKQECKCKN